MRWKWPVVMLCLYCLGCGTQRTSQNGHTNTGVAANTVRTSALVVDSGNVFLPEQQARFDSLFTAQARATGDTVILLTVVDYKPFPDLHALALQYFNDHFPEEKTGYNRLLIVFCVSCNRVQILTGKSTKNVFTLDNLNTVINDVMIPRFSSGQDYDGLMNGGKVILDMLNNKKTVD